MIELGGIIAEQVQFIRGAEMGAWERVLKLHMRPKPTSMPLFLWRRIVGMVLYQSESDRKYRP